MREYITALLGAIALLFIMAAPGLFEFLIFGVQTVGSIQ